MRSGGLAVKSRVHAAGNKTCAPMLKNIKLRCYSSYLWVLSSQFANMGAHTQFTFLKYPCLGPLSIPSDIMWRDLIMCIIWRGTEFVGMWVCPVGGLLRAGDSAC